MEQVSPIEMFFYFVGLILSGEDIIIPAKVIEHFANVLGPRWNPLYLYKKVCDSVYENLIRKPFLDLLWERDSILRLFPDCFPFQDEAINLYCHGCCLLECECPCPSGQHIGMNCRCTCTYCKLPRQFQHTPRKQNLCQCINECYYCGKPLQKQTGMYFIEEEDLCECYQDDDIPCKYKYFNGKHEDGEKTYRPLYRTDDEWRDAYEKYGDALEKRF